MAQLQSYLIKHMGDIDAVVNNIDELSETRHELVLRKYGISKDSESKDGASKDGASKEGDGALTKSFVIEELLS